jgi:hypothetical protein
MKASTGLTDEAWSVDAHHQLAVAGTRLRDVANGRCRVAQRDLLVTRYPTPAYRPLGDP